MVGQNNKDEDGRGDDCDFVQHLAGIEDGIPAIGRAGECDDKVADDDEQLVAGEDDEELEVISKVFAEGEVVLGHLPQILQEKGRRGEQGGDEAKREDQLHVLRDRRELDAAIPINRDACILPEVPILLVK